MEKKNKNTRRYVVDSTKREVREGEFISNSPTGGVNILFDDGSIVSCYQQYVFEDKSEAQDCLIGKLIDQLNIKTANLLEDLSKLKDNK